MGGGRRGGRETANRASAQVTVAQLAAAYSKAVAALDAAEEKYGEGLRPAEKLIAVWDFAGAAEALEKVHFDEADLAARLAARREEAKLLAGLKARLIANINAADPPRKKEKIGLRGLGGVVTGADERGIAATLNNGQEEKHPWAEYGDAIAQKSLRKSRPIEDLLRLVIDAAKADDWVAAGLLALVCREVPLAERCFAKAQSMGAKTDSNLGPLAAALLGRARQLLQEGKPGEAEETLASFEEKCKGIPWFATYKEAIDTARGLAGRKVTEAVAQELYAKAAAAYGEKEFYDLQPLLEELKAKYAATDYVSDAKRTPSLADFEQATVGLGKLITVSQTGKADYKTIQEAVDAAPPKSRIQILDHGPYNEPIVIPQEKEGLTLQGRKGVYPVLTAVGKRTFSRLLTVHSHGFALERLVIVQGDHSVASDDVLHVRCCIATDSWGHICCRLDVTQSIVFGQIGTGSESFSMHDCVGGNSGLGLHDSQKIENVLWLDELAIDRWDGSGDCTVLHCTLRNIKIGRQHDRNTIKNAIVGWISAPTSNNTIENCNVYDKEPYRDLAKPGTGCFSKDPQFVDAKNFDYRLGPKSHCCAYLCLGFGGRTSSIA